MRALIFLSMVFLTCAAGFAGAEESCSADDSPTWRGLNLVQTSCENWKAGFVPQKGDVYAALDFQFVLKSRPAGAAETRSIFSALKQLVSKDDAQEITISVVPRLGSYTFKETPIYSYTANQRERTFGVDGNFEFPTPFVRYDQEPLTFALKVRATNKADHDVKALLDRVKPFTELVSAGGWLVSEAAKPALDAVAGITDSILDTYYNYSETTTATFSFGGGSTLGVVKRVLVFNTSDGNQELGTLVASLKFRRSMVVGNDISWNELAKDAPPPDYSVATSILSLQMPAVGDQKNTLFGTLASDDDKRELLTKVAYGTDTIASNDCRSLRATIANGFGFNDLDTLRTLYELLAMGGKQDAYSRGSRTCFSQSDWRKLDASNIVPDQDALPDKQRVEYFATGLRQGFKDSSIYQEQLADTLEYIFDNTGESVLSDCVGTNVSKQDAVSCLSDFRLNRYEMKIGDRQPIEITSVRRNQVLNALASLPERPRVIPASANPNSATANLPLIDDAKAAAKIPGHVYRFLLFYNDSKRVRSIVLEKADRANVGSDLTERLSFPCWVNAGSQSQTCQNIPIEQR